MIEAILFDFDGVLTTDATGTRSIMNYFKSKTDIDVDRFEKAYRKHNYNLLYGVKTHGDVWQEICRDMEENIDIQVLKASFIDTPLDNEMLSLAYRLKDNGYRIGMITDNKSDRIKEILDYHDLNDLFDVVMVSDHVKSGKNAFDIFKRTTDCLDLQGASCIFIDNSESNVQVAHDYGMVACFFDHKRRNHLELKRILKHHHVLV